MSSYFSRLIQQTEIALGTGETNSRTVQPHETITPLRDEVAVFQPIEEIQVIAPPEDGEFGTQGDVQIKGQGDGEEKFQSMGRHRDAETRRAQNQDISISPPLLNQDAVNRKDFPPPNSARTVSLLSGNLPQPKQLENRVEFSSENILPSDEVETGLNFPNEQPKVKSEKILHSPTNIVQKTPQSPETSLPKQPVCSQEQDTPGESLSAKPKLRERQRQPTTISKEYNPLPTRQANLQAVREWVGGAANSKLNTEPFPSSETQPQEPQNWVGGTENSTLNSTLNTDPSQFPHPQPQAGQNFKLSIGTISLTVEAPQRSVQQPPLPPRKPQQEVKPVSPSSRLNRHYLRL